MHGQVRATFVKLRRGTAVIPSAALECVGGYGIAGDSNAGAHSPRQVLVVAHEVELDLGLEAGALWENITTSGVDVDELGSGAQLQLGDSAVVGLTYDCRPCRVITDATGVEVRRLTGRRGMVGAVLHGGSVRPGDPVRILPSRLAPLPGSYLERLRLVVARIPQGQVLTHEELITAIGGPGSLRRVLPRWLVQLASQGLPAHRGVASFARPLEPDQRQRLTDEGVAMQEGRVASRVPWWSAEQLFS